MKGFTNNYSSVETLPYDYDDNNNKHHSHTHNQLFHQRHTIQNCNDCIIKNEQTKFHSLSKNQNQNHEQMNNSKQDKKHNYQCDKQTRNAQRRLPGASSLFRASSRSCLIVSTSPVGSHINCCSSSSSSWLTSSLSGSRARTVFGCLCTASLNLIVFLLTIAGIIVLLFSTISNQPASEQPHLQSLPQQQQQHHSISSKSLMLSNDVIVNNHNDYYNQHNGNTINSIHDRNNKKAKKYKSHTLPDPGASNILRQIESFPLKANVNEQVMFKNMSTSTTLVSRSPLDAEEHRRVKRGVIYLGSMIKCITGCNPFSYKDYGCYCGFQGDGVPMDGIDSCCQQHDLCYERAECHQSLVYFTPYKWSCSGRGREICSEINTPCSYQLCQCDRIFAKCLARYPCPSEKADCFFPPPAMIFRKGIYSQQNQAQTPAHRRSGPSHHHHHHSHNKYRRNG